MYKFEHTRSVYIIFIEIFVSNVCVFRVYNYKMEFIIYFIDITINTFSKTAFNILVAPSFYGQFCADSLNFDMIFLYLTFDIHIK